MHVELEQNSRLFCREKTRSSKRDGKNYYRNFEKYFLQVTRHENINLNFHYDLTLSLNCENMFNYGFCLLFQISNNCRDSSGKHCFVWYRFHLKCWRYNAELYFIIQIWKGKVNCLSTYHISISCKKKVALFNKK